MIGRPRCLTPRLCSVASLPDPISKCRYNWTESGSFLMPYSQVGAGGVYNDAYRDQTQRAIGEAFEFILHAEVGLKCFIVPNLSLDIEGGFQHLSNGGLASRNAGVNALGGQVGFTYYFGGGS